AGCQAAEVFGGLTVAPQVSVGLGASCYHEIDGAIGISITCCIGDCASVGVDLQRFRLFDGEAGVVCTTVGVRYGYAVGTGCQTTDVFGGLTVAPQVGVWLRATCYYQINRAVGLGVTC